MSPPPEFDRRRASFGSADSFAGGLASPVALSRAPALLLTFAILALLQLWVFELGHLERIFYAHDYVLGPYVGFSAISIRTFMLSFFIAFSIYASGTGRARILFCLDVCVRYIALCIILDLGSIALFVYTGSPFPLLAIQVMAGFAGMAVFAFVIIRRGTMPSPVPVERGHQPNTRTFWRLGLTGAVAAIASIWAASTSIPLFDELRRITLLGGIGPGVILFLLVLFAQLYVVAILERKRLSRGDFRPPVSVIVPAYNEEYAIGQAIQNIDRAAAYYGQPVEVIVIDNGSEDATAEIARATIDTCRAIRGVVLHVATPGKAHALNEGVARASHDFIIRIDADTHVREDNLALAMQNFADPSVGAVGGVPLPPGGAIFDPGRLVEVIVKHGYYSPALSAASGLVGIPGMFVIYRAEALRSVGRFASGMNGEDTDVSLRIAELGYRTLVDQRVGYVSEVPTSFAHLREQRLRWFRSVYHVSARAHSLISSPNFSVRGKLVLPYMLLNTARRAMMLPLAVFGVLELLITSGSVALPHWQAIVAVLIGSPMLAAALAILANNRPRALLSLPAYILFRALRSWYTLESALSIPIMSTSTRIQIGRDPWPQSPPPNPLVSEAV
jgi:cellulose synthase/poly-beta-1,6-N-acetylglucosamine synthase-like glycosyltransferase